VRTSVQWQKPYRIRDHADTGRTVDSCLVLTPVTLVPTSSNVDVLAYRTR
jgi:hypothetical protein